MNVTCVGVRYATGTSQCWEVPVWVVLDPDRKIAGPRVYACRKHVAAVLDSERGSLVLPVTGGGDNA